MTADLLLAALVLLVLAAGVDTAVRPVDTAVRRVDQAVRRAPHLALAAACLLIAVAGFRAVAGGGADHVLTHSVGLGELDLRVDGLAGLFLAVIGTIGLPVGLFGADWGTEPGTTPYRGLVAGSALAVAASALVVLSGNGFLLLFGWEGVSVAFYLLSGYRRERPRRAEASMLTFGVSKASGSALLAGVAVLYGASGSFDLQSWQQVGGVAHDAAYLLLLTAFAAKVGVVPLHVWMPTGYAAAPGPARALMSAVVANIGFYGMWRTLDLLGRPPTWLAVTLLLLAAATALLGIAHASVQRDLQRVIAYSSVENGGLITAGFAMALCGAAAALPRLTALGLLAASLQMVTHALAKSSLFLASAAVEQELGTTTLDDLRGVSRRLPVAGTAFAVGALTLAGLPLTVGLVSEWFLLESVMQLFRVDSLTIQMSLAAAGALLALAFGFAGLAFVRLVGLTVLGDTRAHPRPVARTRRVSLASIGLSLPALGCVVVAAASPLEVRFLARGLRGVIPPGTTSGALASPWVLQPVYPGFSSLSPSWLAVLLPLLALAALAGALAASRGSLLRVRRVPAWRSATNRDTGDPFYTPSGFANPARHVLANVLLPTTELAEVDAELAVRDPRRDDPGVADGTPEVDATADPPGPGVEDPATGSPRTAAYEAAGLMYTSDVVEVVGSLLYRPLLRPLRLLVAAVKRLQSGRLDAYVSYMLIALVVLIAITVAVSR